MRALMLALMLLTACVAAPARADGVDLTVRFDGLEARGGSLRVGLFDSAEGLARRQDGVVARQTIAADGMSVVVRFEDLPPGRYAITAFHDANDNRRLDRFLGVLPREGVALSNDPSLARAPSFDDLAVDVTMNGEVTVRVRYFTG